MSITTEDKMKTLSLHFNFWELAEAAWDLYRPVSSLQHYSKHCKEPGGHTEICQWPRSTSIYPIGLKMLVLNENKAPCWRLPIMIPLISPPSNYYKLQLHMCIAKIWNMVQMLRTLEWWVPLWKKEIRYGVQRISTLPPQACHIVFWTWRPTWIFF
jgi:hypothetical protein